MKLYDIISSRLNFEKNKNKNTDNRTKYEIPIDKTDDGMNEISIGRSYDCGVVVPPKPSDGKRKRGNYSYLKDP